MRSLPLLVLACVAACNSGGSATTDGGGGGSGSPDGAQLDAAPIVPTTQVSVIVEPNGNKGSELVTAINGAHTSVYMTMYEIDASTVLSALVSRKQAGVDVQAILDGSTMTRSFNTPAYNQLKAAGIPVIWSSSAFTYTHEKTVIIDGTSAWIMTMNANTSSPSTNREYLAIDTDPAHVAEATAVFKADHALQSIVPTGPLVVANTNARPMLVALIDSAMTTVDVEGEEFSDTYSTGVVNAVARAASRGVTVRVVVANGQLDATSVNRVKLAGGKVVMTGPTSSNGTATNPYIHAKAIVVDCVAGTCAKAFVGSENFSAGSLGYNRELGVIFSNAAEVAKVEAAIDTDFGKGVPQ